MIYDNLHMNKKYVYLYKFKIFCNIFFSSFFIFFSYILNIILNLLSLKNSNVDRNKFL